MPQDSLSAEDTHPVVKGRPFRALLAYNLPYKRDYLTGGALALCFILMEQATPLVMRAVVGLFEADRMTMGLLWLLFVLLVGSTLVAGAARYFERTLIIRASRKFEYDLRNAYYRRLQRLSLGFFRRTRTGDIMARATNDLNYVRMFIGPGIMGTVDMVRLPITIGLMAYFSLRLTLLALASIPIVSLGVYFFVMYMHRQSQRVQEQFGVVTSRAQENLAGARIVKAYNAAGREIEEFRRESARYMHESMKLSVVMSLIWPLIELVLGLIVLLVLWRGGVMVIRQAPVLRPVLAQGGLRLVSTPFTLGDFTGFVVCLIMLAFPVTQFGWVLTLYQRGAAAMNRIIEVMAEPPEIRDTEETDHSIRSIGGDIVFQDVSFAYDGRLVLDGLHFRIQAGETAAVVGPTGAGKSSLMSLLCREYDPTAGSILIDGVDTRRIPLETLRSAIGYAPQDVFLFSESIRENLLVGKPDATQEELDRACEIAQFAETVRGLAGGYDTLLGERGVNLSGGQKQRLALARALLRAPAILILDDALSSVDTHTEEEILRGLRGFMASRTSILISHRVSTVRHADRILVIRDGRLVEQGTHEQLVELGGVYADMYRRQLLEQRLEGA